MTVFRAATLRTFCFAFHAGAKELNDHFFKKCYYPTRPKKLAIVNTKLVLGYILSTFSGKHGSLALFV